MSKLDVGAKMIVGARELQEDCLAYSVSDDGTSSFIVLADGMGGHSCGEVASGIVVQTIATYVENEVFEKGFDAKSIKLKLKQAAQLANKRLARYQQLHPETKGMGTTLVVVFIQDGVAHWLSIGDSPFLLQDGKALHRLNEDHSMASVLDGLVRDGKMDAGKAAVDPRRSQLTSAVTGQPVPMVDISSASLESRNGPTLIVASDGLLSLSDDCINKVIKKNLGKPSDALARALMSNVISTRVADQDNTSIAVVRVI